MAHTRIPLKVVAAPAVGVIVKAPPALKASEHSADFICGRCAAVLRGAKSTGSSLFRSTRKK
jgi:hypothetical protein